MIQTIQIPVDGLVDFSNLINNLYFDNLLTFNPFTSNIYFDTDIEDISFYNHPYTISNLEEARNKKRNHEKIFNSDELYAYTSEMSDLFINEKFYTINEYNRESIISNYLEEIKRDSLNCIGTNRILFIVLYSYFNGQWYLSVQPGAVGDSEEIENLFMCISNKLFNNSFTSYDSIIKFHIGLPLQVQEHLTEKQIKVNNFNNFDKEYKDCEHLLHKYIDYNLLKNILNNHFNFKPLFLFYLSNSLNEINQHFHFYNENPFNTIKIPNL